MALITKDIYTNFLPIDSSLVDEYQRLGFKVKKNNGAYYLDTKTVSEMFTNFSEDIDTWKQDANQDYNSLKSSCKEWKDIINISTENLKTKQEEINIIVEKFNSYNASSENLLRDIEIKYKEINNQNNKAKEILNNVELPNIEAELKLKQDEVLSDMDSIIETIKKDLSENINNHIEKETQNMLEYLSKNATEIINQNILKLQHELGFKAESLFENQIKVHVEDPLGLVLFMIDGFKKPKDENNPQRPNDKTILAWRNKLKAITPAEHSRELKEIIICIDNYIDNNKKWDDTFERKVICSLRILQHKFEDKVVEEKLQRAKKVETIEQNITPNDEDDDSKEDNEEEKINPNVQQLNISDEDRMKSISALDI